MDLTQFEPCLLIAMPELEDPNFQKAVVLLTDFDQSGASGFVLNRHTDIKLSDTIILSEGKLNPDYDKIRLNYGGPVDPEKIWIVYDGHALKNQTDTRLGDDVMIATDIEILINHENTLNTKRFKVFHGYSGWGAKQLDGEIAASVWITSPISNKLIFDTPEDQMWKKAIQNLGFEPDKLVGPKSPFLN